MKNMLITIIITTVITAAITLITLCAIQSDDTDKLNAEWQSRLTAVEQTTTASIAELRRQSNIKQQTIDLLTLENEILRVKLLTAQVTEPEADDPADTDPLCDDILTADVSPDSDRYIEVLPDLPTNMFVGMDYRTITNTRSDQYLLQQRCTTDENGIRCYGKYKTAAIGSYYSRHVGDTWHITLQCGTEFDIICGDFKDDGKVLLKGKSCENYDGQEAMCVIEFIMDKYVISKAVQDAGTFTVIPEYGSLYGSGGNIVRMEYTGRERLEGEDILYAEN